MNNYSVNSRRKWDQLHPLLQNLFAAVLRFYDHSIITGHRNKEDQAEAVSKGLSKVDYPDSKHNRLPAMACDAAPYIKDDPRGIPWPTPPSFLQHMDKDDQAELNQYIKDVSQFYHWNG